jgi:hypothetical protein
MNKWLSGSLIAAVNLCDFIGCGLGITQKKGWVDILFVHAHDYDMLFLCVLFVHLSVISLQVLNLIASFVRSFVFNGVFFLLHMGSCF